MTQQEVEVVVILHSEGVVQQLLQVPREQAAVTLGYSTTGGIELSIVGVVNVSGTIFVSVQGSVNGQGQTLVDIEIGKGVTRELVTLVVAGVQTAVLYGVCVRDEGTVHTTVLSVSVVEHLDAVRVVLVAAVGVADVEGIDGSHTHGHSPDVTAAACATVVTQRVGIVTGKAGVHTHLNPGLQHIVSLQTAGETLVVRSLGQTFVRQVTH